MTPERRQNFQRLLNPRHIAFVGGRDAITAITEARRRGFKGRMWGVNPRRSDLDGVPCFASVDELPEAPDATYVAVPARQAVDVIADLAARGAGGVVCYTAGFKESGPEGQAAEDRLRAVVGDMALIGPNCYGVINYVGNSALWSFAHGGWSPGYGAAIVTQSGMLSSDIAMAQRSLPMAYMISAGNQAVMGQEDFLDLLADDPAVRAIGLHIEGLRDIPRFEAAAMKALENGTPVVALKTGTSAIGGALTISHTGSLSGSKELYEALFARTGVIQVTNPSQLLETLKYLCVAGPAKGPRVLGLTCSGGGATMLADHGETIGLSFPAFSDSDSQRLAALLPDIATVSNPLDYTTPIWGQPEHTRPVFETALNSTDVDAAVLVQDYPAPGLDESKVYYLNDAEAFADAAAGIPAAICASIPENMDADTRARLIARGVAPMQGIHECLNAIAQAAEWSGARARILSAHRGPLYAPAPVGAPALVTEAEGKARVAKLGLQVPQGTVARGQDAGSAAAALGFPVALKMQSLRIAHKTEAGAVALNLGCSGKVVDAVEQMRKVVTLHDPEAVTDSFLIERMSPPPVAELILGIRRDPQFGHALTLGSGGILVELIGDARTLLLPSSADEIEAALASLKIGKLLKGFRGRAGIDIAALAHRLDAFCNAVLAEEGIHDLEINPLFVSQDGPVAVDVLMHEATR